MTTDTPISNEDKLEICRVAARVILRQRQSRNYTFDELVNEGYVNIKTNDPARAYKNARHYMLQLINRDGIGKRVEATREVLNPETKTLFIHINVDQRHRRVADDMELDELIDVRDALNSLTPEEWILIQERFVEGYTFEQIAPLHGKKYSTSIKFQIDKILLKLKAMLGR